MVADVEAAFDGFAPGNDCGRRRVPHGVPKTGEGENRNRKVVGQGDADGYAEGREKDAEGGPHEESQCRERGWPEGEPAIMEDDWFGGLTAGKRPEASLVRFAYYIYFLFHKKIYI